MFLYFDYLENRYLRKKEQVELRQGSGGIMGYKVIGLWGYGVMGL